MLKFKSKKCDIKGKNNKHTRRIPSLISKNDTSRHIVRIWRISLQRPTRHPNRMPVPTLQYHWAPRNVRVGFEIFLWSKLMILVSERPSKADLTLRHSHSGVTMSAESFYEKTHPRGPLFYIPRSMVPSPPLNHTRHVTLQIRMCRDILGYGRHSF